ncbi:hypothetical protein IYQ_00882 [Aeromonas salmonicida subsp. salmonicida 01-B526]|uniref:Uncharacterized protein n=1 Tax=Aeromonas salmonicida subsp. salmonicida 01-B526 TaxID=1076135 RepID=A0ABN0E548_AERSS|nr:hypothetical protein IYQ_00882 [Aeromonas salmonicida subsp. salmonicida 01-B526]
MQCLHHLQPDKAATDHSDMARMIMLQSSKDAIHVRDIAQGINMRAVDAGERRTDWRGPRAQQQLIVRLSPLFTGLQITD